MMSDRSKGGNWILHPENSKRAVRRAKIWKCNNTFLVGKSPNMEMSVWYHLVRFSNWLESHFPEVGCGTWLDITLSYNSKWNQWNCNKPFSYVHFGVNEMTLNQKEQILMPRSSNWQYWGMFCNIFPDSFDVVYRQIFLVLSLNPM